MSRLAPARPLDLLLPVHKALRCFMFDTVVRVGALDTRDAQAMQDTVAQVRRLLQALDHHDDGLNTALQALRDGPAGDRSAIVRSLYQSLNELVCRRLPALLHEESSSESAGGAGSGSARERAALRQRQLASLDDQELCDAMGWMARALSPFEWAMLHDDLRAAVSATAYARVLQHLGNAAPAAAGPSDDGRLTALPLAA